MKLPRRRYWVPLVLLCSFLAFVRFQRHYHVLGWFRGDAYYQGLPTSYWRDSAAQAVHGRASWIANLHRIVRAKPWGAPTSAIFDADPESADVIEQILADKATDATVRDALLSSLTSWRGDLPKTLICTVRPYLEDPSDSVRYSAGAILLKWDDDGTAAINALLGVYELWSQDKFFGRRCYAADKLYHASICRNDVDIQRFLHLLYVLEQDAHPRVRQSASESLERIRKAGMLEP